MFNMKISFGDFCNKVTSFINARRALDKHYNLCKSESTTKLSPYYNGDFFEESWLLEDLRFTNELKEKGCEFFTKHEDIEITDTYLYSLFPNLGMESGSYVVKESHGKLTFDLPLNSPYYYLEVELEGKLRIQIRNRYQLELLLILLGWWRNGENI